MTLTIALPADTEKRLRECASANGQDVATFALRAIEEKIGEIGTAQVDQVLAPLRREFRDSGMSDDNLHDLLTEARDEARREMAM